MDARTRYTLLMEGKSAPQTITPQQDRLDFGALQTDSPQALLGNPRTTAPGVVNGAFQQQPQHITITVPFAVGVAWKSLLEQHNLNHADEVAAALQNHLVSLQENGFHPLDA